MQLSRKLKVLATLGTLSSAVWASTYATFTDSATSASTFTAGTVDLVVAGEADDAYAFTSIEMANMKPGDVKYAPLTVANSGTLGFTYDLAAAGSNADGKGLAGQLQLGAKTVASAVACDSAGVGYTAGTPVITEGALTSAAIADRALAASTNEVLCVKVALPSSTNDTFQGATTTATLTLSAEQS